MNQSQTNLMRLAVAVRDHKQAFSEVCATAKKLNLPSPKRKGTAQSAATARLQNFVRGIPLADLQSAIAQYGMTSVFNRVNTASIMETAAKKLAEQAIRKAGN